MNPSTSAVSGISVVLVRLLACAAILLLLASTAATEYEAGPRLVVRGYDDTLEPSGVVAGSDGLIYMFWLGGQGTCGDGGKYSDSVYIKAFTSGLGTATTYPIDLDAGIGGELILTGVGADAVPGDTLDVIYASWAARDNCDQTAYQVRYADIRLPKTPSASPAIPLQDTVSCLAPVSGRRGTSVRMDSEGDLHFLWTDRRCDRQVDPEHSFGNPFYRRLNASGVWDNIGPRCTTSTWVKENWSDSVSWADSAWSDNASLVTFDIDGWDSETDACGCCPRGFPGTGCPSDTNCHWWQQYGYLDVDSEDNVHFLWHGAYACFESGVTSVDNTLHRKLSNGTTWGDTTVVSNGTLNSEGSTSCFVLGDTLIVFYPDKYDGTKGLYYRVLSGGSFLEAELVWPDPFLDGVVTHHFARAVSHDDSVVHIFFIRELRTIACAPKPVDVNTLYHREGVFRQSDCKIHWTKGAPDILTAADDTTNFDINDVVCDDCNRIHTFYTRKVKADPCGSVVRSRIERIVLSEDSTTVYDVLTPDGGEEWLIGCDCITRWQLCPSLNARVTNQSLYIIRGEDDTTSICGDLGPSVRAYDWQATGSVSDRCKMMIVAEMERCGGGGWVSAPSCTATSSGFFTIGCGIDSVKSSLQVSPDTLFVCPSGESAEAGQAVDPLLVSVTVRDCDSTALDSLPCELEVTLAYGGGDRGLCVCGGYTISVEDTTDSSGVIELTLSEMGGCGYVDISASVSGIDLVGTAQVLINSPDIDGDCDVDLADYGEFAELYLLEEWCGDFNRNGIVDLDDFGTFAAYFLDECPGEGGAGRSLKNLVGDRVTSIITPEIEVKDGGGDPYELLVCWDGFDCTKYRAVEVLVSYDLTAGEALGWKGCGDPYLMRLEELSVDGSSVGLARVLLSLSDWHEAEGNLLGALIFDLMSSRGGFSPQVERVLALGHDGSVDDVSSYFGSSHSSIQVGDRQLVLAPTLELQPNPSAAPVLVRFGVPLWMGKRVRVSVYDVLGRLRGSIGDTSNNGYMQSAEIGIDRGGIQLSSPGVYFMRLTVDGKLLKTGKVVLLR